MRFFLVVIPLVALASCTAVSPPPEFAMSVPPAFSAATERRTFPQGAPLTDDAMARQMFPDYRAEHPTTRLYGRWTDPSFTTYRRSGTYYGAAKTRGWSVEVEQGASPKVLRALQAKDGYEADLGFALNASPRIYPRFRHKRFSRGEAVSFLVQYQNDNTNYVPNNGMLLYEVHGITTDQRFTIRAQFGLTHPRLTEFGPAVRDYRDDTSKPDSPMRRDRDYRLVEHSSDSAFQPSIKDVDAMLETLRPDDSQ
ncbi:MAG: hypothetical protein ABIR38_07200 [Chthoniobacterales bacterium]